jgi:flagellar hook assembly protein FlgD
MFELAGGVPAAGTVWTMRDYIGAISGGIQAAGDGGPMSFSTQNMPRSFSAIGASVKFAFDLTNAVGASTSETLAKVHTVPDPYYVTSSFEATTTSKIIKFVNLPEVATIRIYTASGVLVRVLQHASTAFGGETDWDVRNRNNQFVASGVYFYHVTAENGETTVGRMTIINYAQ